MTRCLQLPNRTRPPRPLQDADSVDLSLYVCGVVGASTTQITSPVVLVGHSGAGPLLPIIAHAVSCRVAAMIFVDAFLPPPPGTVRLLPTELLEELRALARDGILPPWSRWFDEDAMRDLVPDDQMRSRLVQEMPCLPFSYFEGEPAMTEGSDRRPCAYLFLSEEPYAPAAADARARRWPVAVLPGAKHLHLATAPNATARRLLELERRLLEPT